MSDLNVRLVILCSVTVVTISTIWLVRRVIDQKRRQALDADPVLALIEENSQGQSEARVHILAFSSEDCRQCHTMQAPVLRRVKEARGNSISVIDIDAPDNPDLTERYHVLTVPTTVILDTQGKAHAVNYGFTNAQSLLKQIDEVIDQSSSSPQFTCGPLLTDHSSSISDLP